MKCGFLPSRDALRMYPIVNDMRQKTLVQFVHDQAPASSLHIFLWILMRSSSCCGCVSLSPQRGTQSCRVYTRWHPALGTIREAGPLSTGEASKAGQRAIRSRGLFYHVGAAKHISFLLSQIKHRWPRFNLIVQANRSQRSEITASFPHRRHLTVRGFWGRPNVHVVRGRDGDTPWGYHSAYIRDPKQRCRVFPWGGSSILLHPQWLSPGEEKRRLSSRFPRYGGH